ncbi:MAG TPA: efflux RND transporter periplasmic adaptor subunit [Pyrinomonadaceae bacterium]|nr:efflux RND transporter periplasmic adaptor subunit [Pyrinomonadaceae bacterium]
MKRILNTILLLIVVAVVVGLLAMWLRPSPVSVDVAKASRGPMRVTVDGEGKTRVRDRYVVATPVAGRLRRITLRRGDTVVQRQSIAEIEPLPLAPLDPRQRAEAVGRVRAAEDAKAEVDRMVERYKASYDQARRDLQRSETLARDGVISRQEVEEAETVVATTSREYEAARSRAERAAHDVEVARAALLAIDRSPGTATVKVQAPTGGRVLRVLEESERVVNAGTPLLELSNPSNLEAVIELLSTDAVKVVPGAGVFIENWGGPKALEGRVRLIEPSAFTKVSALGIEEQRVNVIVDLLDPGTALGDGYRIEGRVVIWETSDALRVPVSALFRRGESWSLFRVENGVARLQDVEIGHITSSQAEVTSGLEEGAEVITHPSKDIADGTRVEATTP